MIEKARSFAIEAHGDQMYGDKPYVYHLDAVVEILSNHGTDAKIIGYLHDVVEDTGISVALIEDQFGKFVADCVSILTDEPGDNRKQRKIKTYHKMSRVSGKECLALVVKAADRLANIQACIKNGRHDKLNMYQKEHNDFYIAVYRKNLCDDIWSKILGETNWHPNCNC